MNYNNLNFGTLKLGGYFRKSTESEDRQTLSIDSQIAEMKKITTSWGVIDFTKKYQESRSAKEVGKRAEFLQMEWDIEHGFIDSIACWKLDRLARNMIEGGKIIDWLSKGKLKCIITYEKIWYPSDNVIVMAVEFGQGKQYVKDLSTNVKRGLRVKFEKGFPSGVATIGFENTPHLECGQRYWKIDEARLPLVKLAFKEFLTGAYSGKKLGKYCREVLKLTTPQHKRIGGKLIDDASVNKMLKKTVYAGFFYVNGVRYELDQSLPRLITEEEHHRILRMLGVKNQTRYQKHENIFSGFLTGPNKETMTVDPKFQLTCDCKHKFAYRKKDSCPNCGLKISQMQNPKYAHYTFYFNDTKRYQTGKYKTVEKKKVLEKTYEEIIDPLSLCPELATWFRETIVEIKEQEFKEEQALEKSNAITKDSIEKEKTELRALLRRKVITEEEYAKDLDILNQKVPTPETQKKDWKSVLEEIVDLGVGCREIFENGDNKAKKKILHASQSNLIWNEENLYVVRPNWLNQYVDTVKMLKSEMATVELKTFPENPNKNKEILEIMRSNNDLCLTLSGC